MARRRSQLIRGAEKPVLPQPSRSGIDLAALVSGYSPGAPARAPDPAGAASARPAQGPLPGSLLSPSPAKPAASTSTSGRFSRANRNKARSAYKRFTDVFSSVSISSSVFGSPPRSGSASAPTSPASPLMTRTLQAPPRMPPLSPSPSSLGMHYQSMPSSPNPPSDEEREMAMVSGKAAHRTSLFDLLGAMPIPPSTATSPTFKAPAPAPAVSPKALPFPAVSTLTKEEHVRMVTAAEEERARRGYLRKQQWFKVPPGQALRDRDHKLPMDEAPYWMGYGLATGDADAMLMEDEMLNFDEGSPTGARFHGGKPPDRVLDLGCGVWATWILKALRCWPETTFVGLDIMPVLLTPSMLPSSQYSRTSFIQHNFLHSLPFPPCSFDLVRLSHIGSGVPESMWDSLITAATVLLTPHGRLEILDIELESLVLTQDTDAHANPPPVLRLFRDTSRAFADRRFLDLGHFAHIRAALAVNAGKVETGGKREVGYPVRRRKRREARDDWEVLIPHVAADFTLARKDFLVREYLASLASQPSLPRLHPPASAKQVENAIGNVMGILKAEPIAPILDHRWDWECNFDQQAARMLDSNLLDLRAQQIDLDVQRVRLRGQTGSIYSETSSGLSAEQKLTLEEEEDLIVARGVLALNLREAQSERRGVGMRLRGCGGRGWEVDSDEEEEDVAVSGAMGCQGWVASKPAR